MRKLWPLLLVVALFYANRSCERPAPLSSTALSPSPTPDVWAVGGGPVRDWQAAPDHVREQNRSAGGGLSAAGPIGAVRRNLGRR
jgi:hypothetical protein